MRVIGMAVLGLVIGAAVAFGIGLAIPMITPVSQAEGAYAMGLLFFWTPAGGVLGAICGAILGLKRRR